LARTKRDFGGSHANVVDCNLFRRTTELSKAFRHVWSFAEKQVCTVKQPLVAVFPLGVAWQLINIPPIEGHDMSRIDAPGCVQIVPANISEMGVQQIGPHLFSRTHSETQMATDPYSPDAAIPISIQRSGLFQRMQITHWELVCVFGSLANHVRAQANPLLFGNERM